MSDEGTPGARLKDEDEPTSRGRPKARIGAGLAALALAVPIVSTARVLPVEVPFADGIAWLTNTSRGEVVQVNGQTGQVEAALDLGAPQDISVSQSEGIAVVQIDGEIRSIDLASLEWGETISADGTLVTGAGAGDEPAVYLVKPDGRVLSLDPSTLETLGEVTLAGEPGDGVVAGGRLFVPVSGSGRASVQVIEGDQLLGGLETGAPQDRVAVSRVDDEVAVVNLTQGTLDTLDPSRPDLTAQSRQDLDLPAGEVLVPTELPEGPLWMVAVRDGDLLGADLDSGEIHGPIAVADGRADLEGPAALDDQVFVLNRDTGEIVQIDTDSLTVLTHQLSDFGVDDVCDCEIMAQDGKVFVNDPDSAAAVVFSSDGTAVQVDKYTEDGIAVPMPPSDFASDGTAPDDNGDRAGPPDQGGEPEADPPPSEDPPGGDQPGEDERPPPPGDDDPPGGEPEVPPPPVPTSSVPPPPSTTTSSTTSTTTSSTTTTSTTSTTTTTSTTVPPPPEDPPGEIARLDATPGDGQITLDWSAASSESPVTYHIFSERPIAGRTTWTTENLSHTLTGLTNGDSYSFTVTPSNESGDGEGSSVSGIVPAGNPSVNNATATPAGGRDFDITFSYDLNGGQQQSCTVTEGSGDPWPADECSGGTGSTTLTVPNYGGSHTFTVEVTTNIGSDSAVTPAESAEPKALIVDGSEARWSGSCYYSELGTSRPIVSEPADLCNDTGSDDYIGTAADGSTQRILCYRDDEVIQDNQFNESTTWLQLANGGWMNSLYFDNWGSAADDLEAC